MKKCPAFALSKCCVCHYCNCVIAVNKNILIKSVFVFFAHTTFLQKISFELYYFCAVTPHLYEQKKFSLELDILSIIHQHQIVYS